MTALPATTKLHLNKRETTFLVPLYITGLVSVISVLIAPLFLRSGGTPGAADWVEGSQIHPGMAYALPGFLVYLGVQSVATTFPFALTLDSTRRSFVGGDLSRLTTIVVPGTLSMLTIGGVFGASWIRYSARGPQLIAVDIAIVIIVAIALSSVGTWLLLRSANVR